MNTVTCVVLAFYLCLGFPIAGAAQTPDEFRGQGYLFAAPFVSGDHAEFGKTGHIGGGGEGFVYKGLGVGAELGAVFQWSDFIYFGYGLGSANVSYHFLPNVRDRRVKPFVTAGYSLFVRHGHQAAFNAGAGVNLWLNKNVGLRLELREYIGGVDVPVHHAGPRIGLTFR